LFVLEDLHWVDPISLELLALIARAIERLPVLILLTYRPITTDARHQNINLLKSVSNFTQVELTELNTAESEQAVRSKLTHLFPEQRDGIPHILIERVTDRAQGNPFYVEELLSYIHDRGIDPRDMNALNRLDLPTSLHSLILSRIDHLTSSQQLILKTASIIGRVFQFEHLHKYYPTLGIAEQVKSDLRVMEQLELTPIESPEPNLAYLFKHLVTHEVGYESIAYATRSKLHGQYAEYLEQAYPDKIEQLAAQLAYHYEKADIQQKAQFYLIWSGKQAAANYANEDALSYFNRALKLSPDEHSRIHFDTLMKRERVYDLLGRRAEQRQDLETLARLASGFDDALLLRSQVAIRQAKLEIDEGDYTAAKQNAKNAIDELSTENHKQTDLNELLVDALLLEARAMFLAGQAVAASPQLESALSLAQTHQYLRGEYNALAQLGLWNWYNGDNKAAIELMERSLEWIRQAGDIRRESDILNNLGIVTKDMYRFKDSLAYYEKAQRIAKKIGDRSGEAGLLNNMGRASIMSGELVRAISYCNQAAILARETNDTTVQGLALHNKSEAYKELGQYASAREAAEKSIKLLQSSGYQAGEAWALENLAMVEFMLGEHAKAVSLAEQALTISRAIASRRLEVSVLTRLGIMRLEANQLEAAEEAFVSARKIEDEFKESIPMFEIQAGLAEVALARGDSESVKKAQTLIQELAREILQEPPTEQSHILPLWLYLTCIRVLKAGDDSEAGNMMRRANEELKARSEKISDDALRAEFMDAPESRAILASTGDETG
ncbi:MAG: tetratricopeptide repeat protein, partial [Chloroflexi bacterium]|nr:tetratricopeptide repeat protein [Chloroflexota bacterium]